jgi:hypothetical protein
VTPILDKGVAEWRLERVEASGKRVVIARRRRHEHLTPLQTYKKSTAKRGERFEIVPHRMEGSSTFEPSYILNGVAIFPDGMDKFTR